MRNCRSSEPGIAATDWLKEGHSEALRAAVARTGLIEWSPQKIIADDTDWRFL